MRGASWARAGVIAAGCAGAAVVAMAACITAIPDLPQYPVLPPTVQTESVQPPPGPLVEWPAGGAFSVPVQVFSPGETFVYEVVYDYGTVDQQVPIAAGKPQLAADGGVTVLPLTLPIPSPDFCPHHIDFLVANGFQTVHVPDAVGGSMVSWTFTQGGGPNGCPDFDAGSGAIPDAAVDRVPLAGGDP